MNDALNLLKSQAKETTKLVANNVTITLNPWTSLIRNEEGKVIDSETNTRMAAVIIKTDDGDVTRTIDVQRLGQLTRLIGMGEFKANIKLYETDNDYKFGINSIEPILSSMPMHMVLILSGNSVNM